MKAPVLVIIAALVASVVAALLNPVLAQRKPSADVMIRKQDRNGDRRISRKEWRGPPGRFGQIDTNGDGFLSRAELQNRHKTGRVAKSSYKGPLIDVHAHIFPDASTTIEQRQAMNFDQAADIAIKEMNRNNVRTSVIMGTPGINDLFDSRVLLAQAKRHPGRFAVLSGGWTLNQVVHQTAPAEVTDEVKRNFEAKAENLLKAGAIGFGEIAALHFSYFRNHPFEEVQPDHPLLLLLADIAARHDVPIDLHSEIVPEDMAVPAKLIARSAKNPARVHANLAGLERLLSHNPRARIILSHSLDATGYRTAKIIRRLLKRHSNLSMSLNVFPKFILAENLPLKPNGSIKPEWLRLIKDYSDRFMLGSDQRYSTPCPNCRMPDRVGTSKRWLELLPPDIARKIAIENPKRIFKVISAR